jgi:tRNA pseudouridine55 synthase
VKVGGRRLYEAARAGEELRAEPRPIRVDAFDLLSRRGPDADVRVVCGGGTYVRVLAADVGTALGCGAHLTALRRTAIGPFHVIDAAGPEDPGEPLPVEAAVAHLPRVVLSGEEIAAARNGRVLGPAGLSGPYGVYGDDVLIGVYRDDGAKAVPLVVLAPAPAAASDRGRDRRRPSFG